MRLGVLLVVVMVVVVVFLVMVVFIVIVLAVGFVVSSLLEREAAGGLDGVRQRNRAASRDGGKGHRRHGRHGWSGGKYRATGRGSEGLRLWEVRFQWRAVYHGDFRRQVVMVVRGRGMIRLVMLRNILCPSDEGWRQERGSGYQSGR